MYYKQRISPYRAENTLLLGYKYHSVNMYREIIAVRRSREIAESDCYLRHVCLSVCMEQLGSHWTDFREI